MREIKFRAWDKENKRMIDVQCISNWFVDEKTDDYFETPQQVQDHTGNWYSRIELMQFTGLKDKNGKEIYEGDIITYGFKTKDFNDLVLHTGKIFFDEYMFLVDGDTVNEEWHSINRIHYVEVIGNIYENEELIEK